MVEQKSMGRSDFCRLSPFVFCHWYCLFRRSVHIQSHAVGMMPQKMLSREKVIGVQNVPTSTAGKSIQRRDIECEESRLTPR